MAEEQSDSTLGTAGSADGGPRQPKIPGQADKAGQSTSTKPKRPEDRPGTDPKNPGDFGHH